jgi:hypothetical protein
MVFVKRSRLVRSEWVDLERGWSAVMEAIGDQLNDPGNFPKGCLEYTLDAGT